MLGGVRAHLRAVKTDVAQSHEPGFTAEQEDLEEESRELLRKALPELADGVIVRAGAPDEVHAGNVALAELSKAPGGVGAAHGAIEEEANHQARVVGRLAFGGAVDAVELLQVKALDNVAEEKDRVIGGDEFSQRRRQQGGLLRSVFTVKAHA